MAGMTCRRLFQGFICLKILIYAASEPFFGSWLIEELAEHGYKLSPGTIYPILRSLEHEGLIVNHLENVDGKIRKYYSITPEGRNELYRAKNYLGELTDNLWHDQREMSLPG